MEKQDLHMHSCYSFDSKMDIEKASDRALEQDIFRIAITDHIEPDDSFLSTILKYQRDAERAVCIDSIVTPVDILKGVEVSEPYRVLESCAFYRNFPLDIIIGSVHQMDRQKKAEEDIEKEFELYYLRNLKSVLLCDFDVLGHLGYIARYYPDYVYKNDVLIDEILKALLFTDKVLEINTSAERRCGKGTFPSFEVIKRYKELGGKYVTIGSDAHKEFEVGENLEQGYDIAKEFDLQVVYFKKRQRKEY